MNILAAIFFLTFNILLADVESEEELIQECVEQGFRHGNGEGQDEISPQCVKLFKARSPLSARKATADGKREVFGHRNMMIVEPKDQLGTYSVYAGLATSLKNIEALFVDEKNKEIAVLEKSGMILFFPLDYAGNVSPFRVIKSKEILGSKEIIVLPKSHEVIVFNPKQKAAYFFSRLENEYGREKQIKRGLLRKVADVENLNTLLPKK